MYTLPTLSPQPGTKFKTPGEMPASAASVASTKADCDASQISSAAIQTGFAQ
jgi:hypothetical protein